MITTNENYAVSIRIRGVVSDTPTKVFSNGVELTVMHVEYRLPIISGGGGKEGTAKERVSFPSVILSPGVELEHGQFVTVEGHWVFEERAVGEKTKRVRVIVAADVEISGE